MAASLVSHMQASLTVPTETSFRDVPTAILEAQRTSLNVALSPRRLSFTHLIAYAIAQAAVVHPVMANYFESVDGQPNRVEPSRIGLGIAVETESPDGSPFLMVPVIRAVDDLDFAEFVAAYGDRVERARTGRLTADDLAGGTITLTNPGTVGTSASVPRLMAGSGTIVASGVIRRTGGTPLMTLSSTYDHRIIHGAESGRFLRTIDELLQGADDFYGYVAMSLGVQPPTLAPAPRMAGMPEMAEVAGAMALVRSYRRFGHRAARLDPLGSEPLGDPSLSRQVSSDF